MAILAALAVITRGLSRLVALFTRVSQTLVTCSNNVSDALITGITCSILNSHTLTMATGSPSLVPRSLRSTQVRTTAVNITRRIMAARRLSGPGCTDGPVGHYCFYGDRLRSALQPLTLRQNCPCIISKIGTSSLNSCQPNVRTTGRQKTQSPLTRMNIAGLRIQRVSRCLNLP